MALP
ncbi:hypothetical protein D047_1642A, partial [Vibrio parahaemolyticus VPTS-2010_2]|jgi:hypothetical protein